MALDRIAPCGSKKVLHEISFPSILGKVRYIIDSEPSLKLGPVIIYPLQYLARETLACGSTKKAAAMSPFLNLPGTHQWS